MAQLDELVEFIARSMVSEPDSVEVSPGDRRGTPTLRLKVAPADRGTIIGRQGRNIRAIEMVLDAAARGRSPALEVED